MLGRRLRIGVGMCVHNEQDYVLYSLRSVYEFADIIAVSINTGKPWGGEAELLDDTLELVKSFPDPDGKIVIQTGEWASEIDQRNENLNLIRDRIGYYMIVDADEVYKNDDLARLQKFVAWRPHIGQFRIRLNTYWKTNPIHVIDPPEPLRAYIISRVRPGTIFTGLRGSSERWRCTIPRSVAVCHHFSYARPSERIMQKLRNFSHKHQLVPNWYERVWLGWDSDHDMLNLHPTNPPEYKRAIPVDMDMLPKVMLEHPFVRTE